MRAVCYARVSSAGQRERDTIASQLRVLPGFIERQGWTLVMPVDTYVDDGFTATAGHLDRRLGLQRLLKDAAAGVFDVVVVVDIDRLTRADDMVERGAILGAFQRAGVKVASVMSGHVLDFGTELGELFGMLSAFAAAADQRKRVERTIQGKYTAAQRGRKPQGPTPYGLTYNRDTAEWGICPVRGPIVREMYERTAAGESARAIAADFNARGVPAVRDVWERGRIHRIVKSKYPIGEWTANTAKRIVIKVPPLVERELWARAQAAMEENRKRPLRQHTKHAYLLERIAKCSRCGSTMAIRAAFKPKGVTARYLCRRRREELPDGKRCSAPTVLVADADARVWEQVREALVDPKLAEKLMAARGVRAADRRDWKADAAAHKRALKKLEEREAAIVARFRRGLISERVFDQELEGLVRERDMRRQQIETAERAAGAAAAAETELDTLESMVSELRELAETATPTERLELVRRFIEPGSVVFHGTEIRFNLLIRTTETTVCAQPSSTWTPQADGLLLRLIA